MGSRRLLFPWGLVLLLTAAGTAQLKLVALRYFVPDPSTAGTATTLLISGAEVRFLQILAPARLPRRGGAISALYLATGEGGLLDAEQCVISLGHAPRTEPDRVFDRNLKDRLVVFSGRLKMQVLPRRFLRIPLTRLFLYNGRDPLAIEVRLRGVRGALKLVEAPRSVRAVVAVGRGSFSATRARAGVVAGLRTGVEFATSGPYVSCLGSAQIGSTLSLAFNAQGMIGDAYLAGCSFTSVPGLDIGEYTIPLTPDPLFYSVWLLPQTFVGFSGTVGFGGFGSGAIVIPDEPALVGVSFVVAFVTYNGKGITGVSMEQWVTIGLGCG